MGDRRSAVPVLTVNRVGFLGGVERVILTAGEAVRERGYLPILACPGPGALSDEAQRRGIRVRLADIQRLDATPSPLRLVRSFAGVRRARRSLVRIAREEQARIVHVHHPVGALQAVVAARTLGVPLVFHAHETLRMPPVYHALARWIRDACDVFLCVSEASAQMVRALGVPEARIELIHNAVDDRYLRSWQPDPVVRERQPAIGLFGVIEPRKGHLDFLRACRELRRTHRGLQAWIVGGLSFADNRPYLHRLRRWVREAGMESAVRFTGHRDDIPALMASMDVVVLASRGFESLPTVLIEAAALGRPIVATDVGGVREIVQDGVTGVVVPPRDPAALARGIAVALEGGADLGRRAQADARARFAPERFGNDLAAAYARLLGRGLDQRVPSHERAA